MANTYKLKVDLKLKQTGIVPVFVQYDTARLEFQIFDNGKPFDLTGFTTVEFAHKLPKGTYLLAEGSITSDARGKYISYDYQGSEMAEIGFVETSFSLIDSTGKKKVSIQPFKVNMVSDLRELAFDPVNPDFGKIQQYIAQFESIKERMDIAISKSETAAEAVEGIVTEGNKVVADMTALKTSTTTVRDDTLKVKNDTIVVKNAASQATVNANKATVDANKAKDDTLAVKQQADTLIPLMQAAKANTEEATSSANAATQNTLKAITDAEAIANDWTFKGAYSLNTAYKKTNVISFNGEGYIAKQDSKGVAPTGLETDANWTLISRKGQDGSGVLSTYRETFTATEGQKTFNTKQPYDQLQSRLKITVGGVLQNTPESFMETTSTSFTFNDGLPAGTKVIAEYYSKAPVLSPDIQQQIDQLNNIVQYAEMDTLKEQGDYAKNQGDIAKTQSVNQLTQITDVAETMEYIQGSFLPDIALAQSQFELATDAKIIELDDRVEAGIGAFTEDTEVVTARGGEVNLGTRLNKVTQQLAETGEEIVRSNKRSTTLGTKKENVSLNTFVDDDGSNEVLNKLLPLGVKYDIPFVIAVYKDGVGTSTGLTIDDLKTLQNEHNFEIASHSVTHTRLSDFQQEGQYYELYESWRWLRANGLNVDTYVYPNGISTDYGRRVISQYYKSAMGTSSASNGKKGEPLNTYNLRRFTFPAGDSVTYPLSYYTNIVDQGIADNAWVVWMLHCYQPVHDAANQQILDDLIAYIKTTSSKIVTASEAIDIVGNPFDFNEQTLFISKDGTNNIRDAEFHKRNPATGLERHNGNTLPNVFPKNKVSIDPIISTTAQQSVPTTNRRGTMVTFQNEGAQCSQIVYSSRTIHFRSSNADGTAWDEFKKALIGVESIVSADFGTVAVGQKKQITVAVAGMAIGELVVVTPRVTVLANIHFTYFNAGGGNLRLTMENNRTSDVTLNSIDFTLLRTV